MEHQSKWMQTMVAKHGSEEAVRAFMRNAATKSSRNKGGEGGFHALKRDDPEQFKQTTSKGGRNRAQKISVTDQDFPEDENPVK